MKCLVAVVFLGSLSMQAQTIGAAPQQFVPVPAASAVQGDRLTELLAVRQSPLLLEPYDVVRIKVLKADGLFSDTRVSEAGTLDLANVGPVPVAGRTADEAQQAVRSALVTSGLMTDPIVTLEVVETPRWTVTLSGEVKNPGVFNLQGASFLRSASAQSSVQVLTLSQLIAAGGGLKDTASSDVILVRPSIGEPVTISLGPNPEKVPYAGIVLLPGDEVRVSNVGQAYVIGAVGKQGAIPLKNSSPLTATEAVAMSSGVGFEASANDAVLVRTVNDQRSMQAVRLGDIIRGKRPDIVLQHDDILYVPTNAGKAAIKGGGAGLIVTLASTYLIYR